MYRIDLSQYSNLEALCHDRPLQTKEIFSQNAFYGIDTIIKNYVGIDSSYKLKFVIPHGITFNQHYLSENEKNSKLPIILSYPSFRNRAYKLGTNKLVFNSTSPFCFLSSLCKSNYQRSGLVFFPAHSTHHVHVYNDYKKLLERLDDLSATYSPIVVCLYWKDFLDGYSKLFTDRGYQVISAGHIYDDKFLYRFYDICCHFEFAASNGIGSSLFYSTFAGCKTFIIPDLLPTYQAEADVLNRDHPLTLPNIENEILTEFDILKIEDDKSALLDKYLNIRVKRSRFSMKLFICFSEFIYKLVMFFRRLNI